MEAHALTRFAAMHLAELNLTLACGLPGADDIGVPAYLRRFAEWVELVRTKTERWWPRFLRTPADSDGSAGKFRMMALVTVLQRDLGVRYDPECKDGEYNATDSRTKFIHGLLDGLGGTCVTMPVL